MSAITFGLAATAVLVSMFLVMAIFEHLIIPRVSFFRSRSNARGSSETGQLPVQTHLQEKIQDSVAVSYPADQKELIKISQYLFELCHAKITAYDSSISHMLRW